MNVTEIDWRRFQGPKLESWREQITHKLWKGNVISGETLFDLIPKGINVMSDDVSELCVRWVKAGILEVGNFRPSHSSAALLGLSTFNRGQPSWNICNAYAWTYTVLVDVKVS